MKRTKVERLVQDALNVHLPQLEANLDERIDSQWMVPRKCPWHGTNGKGIDFGCDLHEDHQGDHAYGPRNQFTTGGAWIFGAHACPAVAVNPGGGSVRCHHAPDHAGQHAHDALNRRVVWHDYEAAQ